MEDKFFEKLADEILEKLNREIEKFSNRVALIIERELSQTIGEKAYAWGNLQRSIGHEVKRLTFEYLIRNFVNTSYSQYVYDGTKPHFPPIVPLMQWVRKKGLSGTYSIKTRKRTSTRQTGLGKGYDQYVEDRIIATRIAWSIYKKGTKGIKFFDIALKQALPVIEAELKNYNFNATIS